MQTVLNTLTFFWYGSVSVLIGAGWLTRDQRYLVAESGIGYWLGILGGSMMLLMLVYPVRKMHPNWRFIGSVKSWFRLHMFFGIAGPVLVIFHSGYELGSLNSRVAFFSMLIVAASGLAGRYFYRHIHHGLYGSKIRFEELYQQDENWENLLQRSKNACPEAIEEFKQLEQKLVNHHTGENRSLWFYRSAKWKLDRLKKKLCHLLQDRQQKQNVVRRIDGLRSICSLGTREVLFSYWHLLHFPLFIMLVISGLIHVAAVHFY